MTNATPPPLRARSAERTGNAPASFGGIDKSATRRSTAAPDFTVIQRSEEFTRLRRRVRWFVFPMTILFLAWYIGYVLLAAYAHDFMAEPVVGKVNVGLLLGVLQFVTTVVITTIYVRFANRRIDPYADEIRQNVEDTEQ
ncbi:uncharacterized membrane protein (DUF485 family) [Halopolyspora algeriensis]|uniref:Uncharacterized membrane protein (DUF485 family) n=1 Tax=Halopolyspora algeriensis TaxID=1500506 RepID=A0A368VX87_9ACTN|nr:DUF485 domain-containing protein [Halopolyspora algeriensis]RCW46816.1 uncharacterized membrane protein (DUF485 family) [Halopolyspora algeriensis]